ncbi:sugar-binding domain-containing protein [Mariniflexile sp.]|uniref:sugar-binding domain-containing protein n=1 Tax=Mariniflexile sp. TaxID=1979402 RepID=UPI0035635186
MTLLKRIKAYLILFLIAAIISCKSEDSVRMDLSGDWGFKIDSLDKGLNEQWFKTDLTERISLPGSMAENGLGDDITVETKWTGNMWNDSLWYKDPKMKKYREEGNVKVPFWLSPVKVYYGPAWYQKRVNIPESWSNKHINLELERVHWESTVWVDNKKVGLENSLGTAHNYNLSEFLTPGEHTISIRIDNRVKDIDVGLDAHSISDNTQTNWIGIVGNIELTATSNSHIGNVRLYPNVKDKKVLVVAQIKNISESTENYDLELQVKSKTNASEVLDAITKKVKVDAEGKVSIEYPMGENPLLWDEFNANLYEMTLTLKSPSGVDVKNVDFGLREFKGKGTIFTINERPVFLRGTLECAIFPLTGYPPTDTDSWKRIFKIIQNHGLNHMRFHSWCPPEAAFKAADEMGIYLQVEASAWTTIGDGAPIDKWLYKEAEDIINAYGNHPSFVMMAYGNEPSGKNHTEYLRKFVDHFKAFDNRRVYTSGAGWPYIDNLDFYNNSKPRIQGWNQNLNSIINAKPPQTVFDYTDIISKTPMPYVSHEIGQWCVYPNFNEMSKYTGVLKPKNFEIFKETLEENDMLELADSLLLASGKLQTLCYKADIEAALRTKDFAGFQLLDLHDFPGQGTALIGVLDAFWDEKGYVTPEEYSKFCNETVPLARLEKRVFKGNEAFEASVEVAHYGEKPFKNLTPTWTLKNADGSVFKKGDFNKVDIPIGNGISLGKINVSLDEIKKAQKLTLVVQVSGFENTWDVWVYPSQYEKIDKENNLKVVNKLDASTINYLQKGGNVLLNVTKGDIAANKGGDIGVGFSSVFWNTSWTKEQKPHTLGILCNPEHPALANFPTEYHSNWQWWDAMSNSNAIILDELPTTLTPIVRIVDDWFKNRKTALIFEAKIGNGKLIMSGIDLHTNIENRLEAQQLLYSLKKYMVSEQFSPKTELEIQDIKALLVK